MSDQPGLTRRLGTVDAVVIGLGSMIGAGVFSAFAPAAAAAGTGLLVGLGLAAVVAYCNATASAQLAAQYPTSGGTYVYGRERLGDWWGFLAGWGFVIGKTASCAAMALTFAAYAVPVGWQRPVGGRGRARAGRGELPRGTRTARLTRVIVAVVLLRWPSWSPPGWSPADGRPRDLVDGVERGDGLVRRPAVRGPAVLRLRRLRPHRHDGRGGPRPAAHDPAGDRDRPRPSRSPCTRSSPSRCCSRSARTGSPPPAPLADAVAGWLGWAVPVVVVGGAAAALGRCWR